MTLQDDPFHSFDAWYPKAMTNRKGEWSIDDDRPSIYDVTVELPAELTVASTGEILEERLIGGGRKIMRLRAQGVRGFTIYGSRLWQKRRRVVQGVQLSVNLPDAATHWAERMLEAAADGIAFFAETYGGSPTRHLEIVCPGSLTDHAHGSSAACNVIVIFLGGELEQQYRWLIAHEVAHQYFGSMIGLHRREIGWAPVGLGLMMDHAYMIDRGLDDTAMRKTIAWFYFEAVRRGYDTTLSQPVEKLMMAEAPWSYGWNMALMHGKALFVCSMLEDLLGQEDFQKVVRKIIAERAGGLLTGADLISHCEEALGEPLDWFVADWIDGRAALDYAVSDVKRADDGWLVETVKLGAAGFPVLVEAETATGEKLRQRVNRQKETDWLRFATDRELKGVVVDPDTIYPDLDRANNRWRAGPRTQ